MAPLALGSLDGSVRVGQSCSQRLVKGSHVPEIAEPHIMALQYAEILLEANSLHFQFELEQVQEGGSWKYGDFLLDAEEFEPTIPRAINCSSLQDTLGLLRRVASPNTPPEVRLQAAVGLSMVIATQNTSETDAETMRDIEQKASSIISTLSTAAVTMLDSDGLDVVRSLCRLVISPRFALKMVKRRCTLLALVKHLSNPDHTSREAVLLACNQFLVYKNCKSSLASGATENIDILRQGLTEAARNETSPKFQLLIVSALHRLIMIANEASPGVLDVFRRYAYNGTSDSVGIEAAVSLSKNVGRHLDMCQDYLWAVADFTTFPYPKIRREALNALDAVTSSPEGIINLLEKTEFVENASLVVQHGCQKEREDVLNIIRQIARSSLYHENLLADGDLLSSIVQVITDEGSEDSGVKATRYATEIVLVLLSNEENLNYFHAFQGLIPWLSKVIDDASEDDPSRQHVSTLISKLSEPEEPN